MKLTRVVHKAALLLGVDLFSRDKADRQILEKVILAHLASDARDCSILFVGCDYYTKRYNRLFETKKYFTIEPLLKLRKYGSPRHIVDTLEHLDRHFEEGELDAIVCNGVFGWGLNDRADVELAFGQCHSRLSDGGLFVLGWDDLDEHRPLPLSDYESLQAFSREEFGPLKTSEYLTDTSYRHVYSFFTKRAPGTQLATPPLNEQSLSHT